MNLVNTYLLFPLQRKIFKNFGYYDYQTSTFHLNEERVNEVLFDPAYNPFVDVLRETSHASAVASSKSAAHRSSSSAKTVFLGGTGRQQREKSDSSTSSPLPQRESVDGPNAKSEEAGTDVQQRRLPCVQLLEGKIRSSGLASFLRQATTQKSLSVELVDLVFSVEASGAERKASGSGSETPLERGTGEVFGGENGDVSSPQPLNKDSKTSIKTNSSADSYEEAETSSVQNQSRTVLRWPDVNDAASAMMTRSYSLEDHLALFNSQSVPLGTTPPSITTATGAATASSNAASTGAANRFGSFPSSSPPFHTVVDLMRYLKSQLRGLTVGVEEVRLTLCVPPAAVPCSAAAYPESKAALFTSTTPSASKARTLLRRGTCVVHFSCRRGLRFSVDESAGVNTTVVEDMQCSVVVNDWQCYLHVMADDGPVPTTFSLDELIMTTAASIAGTHEVAAAFSTNTRAGTGTQTVTEAGIAHGTPKESAPITVHLARCSLPPQQAKDGTALPSCSATSQPRVLVDVEAAGGWSLVLTAAQVAHFADIVRVITADANSSSSSVTEPIDNNRENERDEAASAAANSVSTPPPSLSSRWVAEGASGLQEHVDLTAVPLESGDAVGATALAAMQPPPAAKFVCVHSAGCSVTLLTQAVVEPGVVAEAWRGALLPQELSLLTTHEGGQAAAAAFSATQESLHPVFEALASPHFTYVMRDVDALFPNIESRASSSSAPRSRVFATDRKKRAIYRNLFKNDLADPMVTAQLAHHHHYKHPNENQQHHHSTAQSFFLGIGSVTLMEYRHAVTAATAAIQRVPQTGPTLPSKATRILRPAQLLQAERVPYALVVFHRSTPPLPDKESGHIRFSPSSTSPVPTSATLAASHDASLSSTPSLLCVHKETIVVGLASVAVQIDPELLDVLTAYALTLTKLTQSVMPVTTTGTNAMRSKKRSADSRSGSQKTNALQPSSPPPALPNEPQLTAGFITVAPRSVRVKCITKVLFEGLEASVRFPLYPPPTDSNSLPKTSVASTASATSPPTEAALPSLLARLLQRLSESSLHTHRQLNVELLQNRQLKSSSEVPADAAATLETRSLHCRRSRLLLEQLGFPEDVCGKARFLPELLRFSIRDLQLVQTHASSIVTPSVTAEYTSVNKKNEEPRCTSVKWREAVVYTYNVLEETKSELFRVDYSPEMSIRITHTCLPDEVMLSHWQALRRVLTLQVFLGNITTTVLTQDDFLLASYYVQLLLRYLTQCRQRLHGLFAESVAANRKVENKREQRERQATKGETVLQNATSTLPDGIIANKNEKGKSFLVGASAVETVVAASTSAQDVAQHATNEETGSRKFPSHCVDAGGGTVAEAFATADTHNSSTKGRAGKSLRKVHKSCNSREATVTTTTEAESAAQRIVSPLLSGDTDLLDLVPNVWCHRETTCTVLDVQIGCVRLGLFAPRLSPLCEVVGEPLLRCLPAAQRHQLADLNCLYHTYIVEVVGVTLCGLVANGALNNSGQNTYVRARFGGLSLWERQPLALPANVKERDRGEAPARSSLHSSCGSDVEPTLSSNLTRSPYATTDRVQRITITSHGSNNNGSKAHENGSEGSGGHGPHRDLVYYLSSHYQNRNTTLVQLIQSYVEVHPTAESGEDDGAFFVNRRRGDTNFSLREEEYFLYQLWSSYLRELMSRLSEEHAETLSHGEHGGTTGDADVGVCEICLLEYTAGCNESPSLLPSSAFRSARDTRYVRVQLNGLGLHHTVSYNGDHLAAVLKNYFSVGEDSAAAVVEINGAASPFSPLVHSPSVEQTSNFAVSKQRTAVYMDLINLMVTYRPRGVGRSLAVLLLPRASILVKTPVFGLEQHEQQQQHSGSGVGKLKRDKHERPGRAPRVPLAMQAQVWLHASLPLYVCNDCDVEALAREVLDPTESNDWGADLEGAGFVRLCEVISTAPPPTEDVALSYTPAVSDKSRAFDQCEVTQQPQQHQCTWMKRRPNLTVSLQQPDAGSQNGTNSDNDDNSSGDSGSAERESATAVRVRYLELSAFMAKDAFEVLRELVETWAAGTDLQALDTPAALVMRSGPGFEWVAEEVARSCAPMTFRFNPALLSGPETGKGRHPTHHYNEGTSTQHICAAAGAAGHSLLPDLSYSSASRPFQISSASPLGCSENALANGVTAVPGDAPSMFPTYDYENWWNALHAAQGRDLRLAEAYQARVAALLDRKAAWVLVRRPGLQNKSEDHYQDSKGVVGASFDDSGTQPTSTHAPTRPAVATVHDTISCRSYEENEERATVAHHPEREGKSEHEASAHCTSTDNVEHTAPHTGISSVSSSFSDLSDFGFSLEPLRWHLVPSSVPNAAFSETVRRLPAAAFIHSGAAGLTVEEDDEDDDGNLFDLCVACEHQPHFLSCWSRDRTDAVSPNCPVSLDYLERTDDALLHDTTEKYLYPPIRLQFFLCDCAINVSLYEGTDLMAAAVRKQRQGYLQIVSRGAHMGQAVASYSLYNSNSGNSARRERSEHQEDLSATEEEQRETKDLSLPHQTDGSGAAVGEGRNPHMEPPTSGSDRAKLTPLTSLEPPSESSASRLSRLNNRGCRTGFGDRNASKRLVLSCRGITVQLNTFPQAAEEDLWLHVVVGETTVFDCIEESDVHRLLTATPGRSPATTTHASLRAPQQSTLAHSLRVGGGGEVSTLTHQLELTGLLTSPKRAYTATTAVLQMQMTDAARPRFTASHFQQGGSELSLVVRMHPMSLTWSGASFDFAQSFFSSSPLSSAMSSPLPPFPGGRSNIADGMRSKTGNASFDNGGGVGGGIGATYSNTNSSVVTGLRTDDSVISGTEAPPIFFRRIVILPTTLTVAGSFHSDKGVLAALAEGKSLDALRSVPVLSWVSVQDIPLPIPFMRIEDCSSAAMLLQRVVEDSKCVSVRFLLTALCCGLQPLSAVARVGEAAKGLLLLPLSQYRGAAFQHAIRTASSVFMQELLTQTSGVAALLASGSYHASRSLLEVLISPADRRFGVTAEPSRALQPTGLADGWRQGQEQLRTGLEDALMIASYCTGPDGSLLRLPAAALRMLMGVSGAATTMLWGARNSQSSAVRDRDSYIYKK